jgi:hypothetical protein
MGNELTSGPYDAATSTSSAWGEPADGGSPSPVGDPGTPDDTPFSSLARGGHALSAAHAEKFGRSLGTDLSAVRLHDDAGANARAAALEARAFTIGKDIYFGGGEYDCGSAAGERLLAHEVAHTVQQDGAAAIPQCKLEVSTPADAAEREADDAADAMVSGRRAAVSTAAPGIWRTALSDLPPAVRHSMQVDTTDMQIDPNQFFNQGQLVENSRIPLTFTTNGSFATRSELQNGLHVMAIELLRLARPGASPDGGTGASPDGGTGASPDGGAANPLAPQGNRTIQKEVDLSNTAVHGPTVTFRFTLTGADHVLIEDLGATNHPAPVDETLAARYGFTRGMGLTDDQWRRVLATLPLVPQSMLSNIQDITFDTAGAPQSSNQNGLQEDGEYQSVPPSSGSGWTRTIMIYTNAWSETPDGFAGMLTHEIGHAISDRAREQPRSGAGAAPRSLHERPGWLRAVNEDGGLHNAITPYGATDLNQYFAEAFSMFITQPTTLLTLRPSVYQYFLTYKNDHRALQLPNHPDANPSHDDGLGGEASLTDSPPPDAHHRSGAR